MKFGGAAVATPAHFDRVCSIIAQKRKQYERIAIVVSAMANTTDDLIALALEVNPYPPQREYDMLVTVGERISISLLAMALAKHSIQAKSFTGSQSGIITTDCHTNAEILEVRPHRLEKAFEEGLVVIVAGFQGVSKNGEITTLGRGGSDTSAVALGVALGAEVVEFYKDVPGIFERDPKSFADAKSFDSLDYDRALQIVREGACVLHSRCIELAKSHQLPLYVCSFTEQKAGSVAVGTLVK